MKKGMIKASVFYPNSEGKKFDLDYYCTKHFTLLTDLMGESLKSVGFESELSGAAPDSPAPFVAIANLYFDSLESFKQAFGQHTETLMGDLSSFTDIEPIAQISKVMT